MDSVDPEMAAILRANEVKLAAIVREGSRKMLRLAPISIQKSLKPWISSSPLQPRQEGG